VAVDVASAAPTADLSASVSPPTAANPGSAATVYFSARNNGPERAQSVNVRVELTRGASTFVSLTGTSGWSCSKPTPGASVDTYSCSTSQLSSGQLGEFELVIRPKADFTGTISVGVRVASSTSDPNVANDTSTSSIRVIAAADIGVTVSGPTDAPANLLVTYTFTVRNNGPGVAGLFHLQLPIPSQTEWVSTRTYPGTCRSPGSTGMAVCSGSLGVRESRSIELVVKVDPAATGTITARGETIYENDPNGANNAASLTLPVTHPRADLAVTVNASTSFTAPGAIVNYAIRLVNNGPDTAYSAEVTVPVPAQTTTQGLQSLSGWGCAIDVDQAWFCGTSALAPGAAAEFYFSVRVNAGATGSITFSATATAVNPDPVPGNNTVTAVATIADGADVGVTLAGPAAAAPDSEIAYVATVTNNGPGTARDVSAFFEDYPGTFVSIDAPSPWECNGPNPGATSPAGCNLSELAAGASTSVTIVVHVDPDATDSISNGVTVASLTDPNGANDSAFVDTLIGDTAADLSVAKTGPAVAAAGTDLTYGIALFNGGPDAAVNVRLTDRVPDQTTFVSLAQPQGWACTTPAVGTAGDVVCTRSELAVGERGSFTLVVRSAASAAGTITNTASITSDTPELAPSDNISSFATTVPEPPASPTSVLYNGEQVVNVGFPLSAAAAVSSDAATCLEGRLVEFTLDADPFTGVAATFFVGAAPTASNGQATAPPLPSGDWREGVYTITATVLPRRGCAGATDSTTMIVAAPGTAASGAGWYTLPGSGRVSFGLTARLVPGTADRYTGSVRVVNNERWRLRGTLGTYSLTAGGLAAASGVGELSWWNPQLNGGLGGWALAAANVPYTMNFTAAGPNKKTEPGTFGIRIVYGPVPPQPPALPNSGPQPLRGGSISAS
jgi:uncharacterized repeat protein (TIGR01451 family)